MDRSHVVCLFNLLQDVNVLRPLVLLARRELGSPVLLLLSERFIERDLQGTWQAEIVQLCNESGAVSKTYETANDAVRMLVGKRGLLIAGSESSLSAHRLTHEVMRGAPPTFLKVTLQHGFECVGFLQNRDHDKAHGRNVTFAADVICGWGHPSLMHSVVSTERSKYYWSGPTALIEPRAPGGVRSLDEGLVCENLHSARMTIRGDVKAGFIDTFLAFCAELDREARGVALRPHPGGQYVIKNNVELPANARLDNRPMYRVDLGRYAYGISAPSSVLVDMVLAGIPAAVWLDEEGLVDGSYYGDLETIGGLGDWLAFDSLARRAPESILERQRRFLDRARLLYDPTQVRERFIRLLAAGSSGPAQPQRLVTSRSEPLAVSQGSRRILFIANGMIPTLQLSFLKPLTPDAERGDLTWSLIFGEDIKKKQAELKAAGVVDLKEGVKAWLDATISAFAPTIVVFCRYSDRFAAHIVAHARDRRIPLVFHIDDDLLNVPIEIGEAKYRVHNAPDRLATVRLLLERADVVYCSTEPLVRRFRELGFTSPMVAGEVYCTGTVLSRAEWRPVGKIGYMGFDHAHDLATILPALIHVLRTQRHVTFELFGSIPKPGALDEFGDRVSVLPPVRGYTEFLQKFASLGWDVGLCPLAETAFNRVKANTKWVEYTSIGAAVVATRNMVYDPCCGDGCGLLAQTTDEWIDALELLCKEPTLRWELVDRAQAKLEREYSDDQLRRQIRSVFEQAEATARGVASTAT